MTSFFGRMMGAAKLDVGIYEEVEADGTATRQAMGVVLLSSLAAGVGSLGLGLAVATFAVGALLRWVIWAFLTYIVGTRLLPESQTEADMGQMMRTLGFAQSPGVLRVFGSLPGIGPFVLAVVEVWMLVAMVIAVRQALDYTTTWRAAAVCIVAGLAAIILVILLAVLIGAPAGG